MGVEWILSGFQQYGSGHSGSNCATLDKPILANNERLLGGLTLSIRLKHLNQLKLRKMDQNIILRSKPRLEISFAKNEFEVIDDAAPNNNGIYSYANLKSIELKYAWFMTTVHIVKYIIWILNLVPFGPQIKDKANLKILLNDKMVKLWLNNSDMEKAKTVKQKLNEKKPAHNSKDIAHAANHGSQ